MTMTRELTGRHVLAITVGAFAVIIGVNLTMAYFAVGTFPGLEVKNTYVASQQFDKNRTAQIELGWSADAEIRDGTLSLAFRDRDGAEVSPAMVEASLGRATHANQDQGLDFAGKQAPFRIPVDLDKGKWELRLTAWDADGTAFQQRIELFVE